MIASGRSSTNSFANDRILSASPTPQRTSVRRLLPSAHPSFVSAPPERRHVRLRSRVSKCHQHADAPYPLRLLRVHGQRPRYGRNTTNHFDELAPPHVAISLRLRTTYGIGSSDKRKRSSK